MTWWRAATAAIVLVAGVGLLVLAACAPHDDPGPVELTPTHTPEWTPTATPTPSPPPSPTPVPPTPTPEPSEPTPASDLLELQAALQAEIDGYWQPGNYAFAVTDLQTGETVSVYGDRQQLSACITNLFVLLQVTLDIQAGLVAPGDVDALIAETTWSSNATTAWRLYGVVGGGDYVAGVRRVGELIAALGLASTIIDHPPAYGSYSLGIDTDNWVTAEDANRALAIIWNGDLLEPEWREYLLGHLENVKPGLNYLTASLPARVHHKNGFFPYPGGFVDNDAGIVRFTVGGVEYAFAITFLSEEVPVKYGDIPLGQTLAAMAYDFFVQRYLALGGS